VADPVAEAFSALVGGGVARRELDRGARKLRWLEAGAGTPNAPEAEAGTSGALEAEAGTPSVVEAGAGTAVVFEAGAMSPVATYAAVFWGLAGDHRVIAYDRAGYGVSDPAPLSVELQVGDLVALLEEVGPAVVVGHSWGGLLAQLATWERPELVRGLVLLDPSHETFWQDAEPMQRPDRSRPPTEDPRYEDLLTSSQELAEDVARSIPTQADSSGIVEACLGYLRTEEQLFTHLDELPMILAEVGELAARRAAAVWPQIPVMVLTATKGRPPEFTPWVVAVQEQLATECNGRHQLVPDSGHYLHIDRPDLVIGCVRGLL
jgi:pimeloyl-ACP methyl ester carboxylesterase